MGIRGLDYLFIGDHDHPPESHKRDKSRNTPEFNKKAKARRAVAKKSAVSRKKNRK